MSEHVYFQTILANMCVLNRVYSLHYDYENDFILSKHIVKLENYDIFEEYLNFLYHLNLDIFQTILENECRRYLM